MDESTVRELARKVLDWSDAHVSFDAAVRDVPVEMRARRVGGFPHSLWELIEHIHITQADILDFCLNPDYVEMEWPREYWPEAEPENERAWDDCLDRIRRDRQALQDLATDRTLDLTATIPHGSGQTYLRELLLVADHTAYHVGQIVAVRRALGIWPGA